MKKLFFAIALLLFAQLAAANCEKIEIRNSTIQLTVGSTGNAYYDVLVYAEAELRGSCNVSVEAFAPQVDGAEYSIEYKPELIQPRSFRLLPVRVKIATQNAASRFAQGALFANDTTSSKSSSAKILVNVAAPVSTPTPAAATAAAAANATATATPVAQAPAEDSVLAKYGAYIVGVLAVTMIFLGLLFFFYNSIQR